MIKSTLKFINGNTLEVGTMYCIGKNYSKHAKEMGGEIPKEPLIFLKPPAAYIENGESVILPNFSNNIHHEVELVVVIGKDCRNVSRKDAKNVIAGYAVGIDVTLRDIQNNAKNNGEPWAVAKGFYTSAPVSQVIPADEFNNIPFFDISIKVNGETRQSGNTKEMERPVDLLIEYLSNVFTLREGDIIFTGTPEGVGPIKQGDKLKALLQNYVSLEVDCK